VLTGEDTHDRCFVCGPHGSHRLSPLPPYPPEWSTFLHHQTLGSLSRTFNNVFTMTALGVYDGDFMHFDSGISAVTLAGGWTYHRLIPATEGQHAIRWFIYDPATFLSEGLRNNIPSSWIQSAQQGLQRVNPYVQNLESLRVSSEEDCDEMALHLDLPERIPQDEIAAVISLAPACPPTSRTIVIRRAGETVHRFLPLSSPYVQPLHYVLLFPSGELGWYPGRLNAEGKSFSQSRWHRSQFFINAERLSYFSRLTGEPYSKHHT
jgi:hypothetical protein